MSYCAYVHARPETVTAAGIFYVGKGLLKRARSVLGRNQHHRNVVSKHGAENILVGTLKCSTEQTAFELEKGIIKCLRRMGVALTNLTDGGEGTAGIVPSEESNAKRSAALKGIPLRPEHAEKIRAALAGRPQTETSKANMSAAQLARFSTMSKDELANVMAGLRAHVRSPEEIERRSVALKAGWAKRKLREQQLKNSQEIKNGHC